MQAQQDQRELLVVKELKVKQVLRETKGLKGQKDPMALKVLRVNKVLKDYKVLKVKREY